MDRSKYCDVHRYKHKHNMKLNVCTRTKNGIQYKCYNGCRIAFFLCVAYYCRNLLLQVKIIAVEPFLFERFCSVVRAAILKDNEATAFVE